MERNKAGAMEGQRVAGHKPDPNRKCTIIYGKRRPDLRAKIEGKQFSPDDKIFREFIKLGGKGSGTIYVLDEDTKALVFAVKITETKDLTKDDKTTYNTIFQYFEDDRAHHKPCTNNGAMIAGRMIPMGYRESQKPGEAFGTYACKTPGSDRFLGHSMGAAYIHHLYAKNFRELAPALIIPRSG